MKIDAVSFSSAAVYSIWQTHPSTGERVGEQGKILFFFFFLVSPEMKILRYKNNLHNNRNK